MKGKILICMMTVFLLFGCKNEFDPNVPPVTEGSWSKPAVGSTWQWQLQSASPTGYVINTSYDVDIYDIDLFDSSDFLIQSLKDSGKIVICYFSAGTYEDSRPDKSAFPSSVRGKNVVKEVIRDDAGNVIDTIYWDNENWLDIKSTVVHDNMRARLNLAKQKGCDGVEPDNMDAYQQDTGFDISETDQLAFNRHLANEAHERGLSVGLKNDLSQVGKLVDYYDFAVNEACFEQGNCNLLTPFIDKGKPVLNAEYKEAYVNDPQARQALCEQSKALQFSTLILSDKLDDSIRFSCE